MKWQFVFNTNLSHVGYFGNVDKCLAFVKTTGYKFFIWNGQVLDLEGNDTGITTKDLD